MNKVKIAAVCLFLLGCLGVAKAQTPSNTFEKDIAQKFEYYKAKKQQGVLFAHFDKNIYSFEEYAWFTAYLIDGKGINDVISVILVNDEDRSIVMKDKFMMDSGYASGSMFLPDSIPPGNYSFILYTNRIKDNQPENVFVQQITLKGRASANYKAQLILQDTAKIAPATGRKVLLLTDIAGANQVSGATVNYFLGNKEQPAMSGSVKTDAAGQYTFTIPSNKITTGNNVLYAQITYNGETKSMKIMLPVQSVPTVRFYPEGGNLADGVESVVGWEAKNASGAFHAAKGTLYKDGTAVDTVSTNEFGMGKFKLTPQAGANYYVKLNTDGATDSVHQLPKILTNVPVLNVTKAVANDSLVLTLKSKLPGKYFVLLHNYQQLFSSTPIQADGKSQYIDLKDIPRGITEVTILDSLERPVAERLFFAHYNKRNVVEITTDKTEYKTRQKVTVKLHMSMANGSKPTDGFVSVAAVQGSRLDPMKTNDIESYFYLNNELGAFPVKQNYFSGSASDKNFLENILLIKGWRRYSWPELMQTTAADTIVKDESLAYTGSIKHLNKPVKAVTPFTLTRDSARNSFVSTANGTFTLTNDKMYVSENEKVHLFVNGNESADYFFTVNDPYVAINKQVAEQFILPTYNYVVSKSADQVSLKGFETSIQLKEVQIRGSNDTLMNACGDYYCINGILNCPNHHHDKQNHVPIKGKTYYIFNPLTQQKKPFVYQGCNPDDNNADKGFAGIHYNIDFYPADYSIDNPTSPDLLSTLYWNHLYSADSENKAEISFYTSDITGQFKIVVQGTTDKGIVYGEKTINVVK
jgi:hypothetical protein